MSRLLHTVRGSKGVFLAVPAYRGVTAGLAHSLAETARALTERGITFEIAILEGECHVDDARNKLVHDFLKSDAAVLVFLDADIRFEPSEFMKLLDAPAAVVGATYPFREGLDEDYPVRLISERLCPLMPAEGVPTGFLKIRRDVLERLAAQSEWFIDTRRGPIAVIFERQIHDGIRWGGDYVFCRKVREMGTGVFVMPDIWLEHGDRGGSLGAFLRAKAGEGVRHCLAQIEAREESPATFAEIFRAWENPFAATPALLRALTAIAREAGGPILEFGAGLSSVAMAAATTQPVHALETDSTWFETIKRHAPPNLHLHRATLVDGWYSTKDPLPAYPAIVFMDGPPRAIGNRSKFNHLDYPGATVVMDDAPQVLDGFHCIEVGGRFAAFRGPTIREAAA